MNESLRILKLLYYKNLLTRKRQWKMSLIGEIIIPVGFILCVWAVRNLSAKPPIRFENSTYYDTVSKEAMIKNLYNNELHLYFTPNNNYTVSLIENVVNCLHLNPNNITLFGYTTEEKLVTNYQKNEIDLLTKHVAIVFTDKNINDSTKSLDYKIRSSNLLLNGLYNIFLLRNMYQYYTIHNIFIPLQICLDESFIASKMKNIFINSQIFVQRMPYPPYVQPSLSDSIIRQLFATVMITSFMIPLFIETSNASSEKFFGIHILMSMNGITNTLNLFSWLCTGIIFVVLVCITPIVVVLTFSTNDALPFINYGNPFLIWLALSFHIGHLFTYGIHISAYFSKFLYVIFGISALNICSAVLQLHGLTEETYEYAPYLGIIFPNMLLNRIIEELNYYETTEEGIQWNNLYSVGNPAYKVMGSVGMVLLLSLAGILFHFTIAVYVYAINPGKYGIKKHPLFFLQSKNKTSDNYTENLEYNDIDNKPFESISKGTYIPGIQLRNLKKSYNISLFSNTQVQALRGISIDFYKGQITSLLGHNGAGKTTMMSILTGMMNPTDGLVLINSKNLMRNSAEIMNDMGLCPQENILFPSLSVKEQLLIFAMLKGKEKSESEIKYNLKAFLEKLKLYDKRNSLPNELSGGQKRRVCLGMALIGDSSTLILDEPTSGLDPESKRIIWDILLKMRGQKTILISTHDMEEADILGDRIAIMHTGQLKSYGTSMFLKKLIGKGNVKVSLSIEPRCDIEKLYNMLNCKDTINNDDGNRIILNIPNSPNLPDWLDNLENSKSEYGISGLSVSLITLEQVFLKVTQTDEDLIKPPNLLNKNERKVTGVELLMQFIRSLLRKKIIYTKNNLSMVIVMIILILVALLSISLVLKERSALIPSDKLVTLKYNMYNDAKTYYKSYNTIFGNKYRDISKNFGSHPTEAVESNLNDALINYAKKDLIFYNNHLIAAAEFNESLNGLICNALYSEKIIHSFPISVNLVSNTIIKSLLNDDYSISISSQNLPSLNSLIYTDNTVVNGFTTAVVFVFLFCPAIALFVVHPLRESLSNVKHLQRMSGVSGFTYWGTMFLIDFAIYVFIIALVIVGFILMAYFLDLQMYDKTEILISVLLFILFGINSLPLVYIFSFINAVTSSVVRMLTYIPMSLVIMELIMCAVKVQLDDYEAVKILRPIQKRIFLLIPYLSFFHSQISFYTTAQQNSRCKKLPNEFYNTMCNPLNPNMDICCELKCYDGKCKNYLKYFTNFENDITLEESVVYLSITPILYIVILFLLESKIIQKLIDKTIRSIPVEYKTDEEVKKEKLAIADKIFHFNNCNLNSMQSEDFDNKVDNDLQTFHKISLNVTGSGNQVFLVYELRKQYGKLLAVKDVSFRVNQHECFGLLGVNGAGKSTTFRMMTGGEIAKSGIMYIGDINFQRNTSNFLSQMGYCPQNDAIITSLNAFEHLRLFANLRGISKNNIENEVNMWIQRLNLNVCASQPSGTYSGGNKRRLNIAMALIGNPNLILLDEPTTGVDPAARRSLWNVIQSCQKNGQAIVLTSHSMEECEVLCNRLAIMVNGRLVCIGTSQELKQRFGAGYDIKIKMNPEKAKNQVDVIKDYIVNSELDFELVDQNIGFLVYHVTPNNTTWRKMYDVLYIAKEKYNCIDDFSVVSSTLEQLFLLFAKSVDKDYEHDTKKNYMMNV